MLEILQHRKTGVFQSLAVLKAAIIYSCALYPHDSACMLSNITVRRWHLGIFQIPAWALTPKSIPSIQVILEY